MPSLTPREQEVAALVSQGLTNKEIAQTLRLSTETIKTYVRQIFEKTGVSNRTKLCLQWNGRPEAPVNQSITPVVSRQI